MNRYAVFLLAAGALSMAPALASGAAGPSPAVPADRIVAGPTVRLPEDTAGDLIAAGGRVELAARVGGDALVAGGELRVGGSMAGNVYVAGGRVHLDGEMARNLRAAGGQVELGSAASLAGNATIAAGDVSIRGPIKGSLSIAGGRALIDSTVEGDVNVTAGQIELGPQARIGGSLRWRSQGELQRHTSAQVAGPVVRLAPVPGKDDSRAAPGESRNVASWLAGLWWTVGMVVVAAVTLSVVPGLASEVGQTWRERAGISLLTGFVALVCIPVAMVLLFITVIGVPLALLALLLYCVLLPMGYVSSAIGLGQWGLARWKAEGAGHLGWRIGATSVALVLLALLGEVPWLGGLVALAALLVGLGAIVLQFWPRTMPAPNRVS